MIERTLIVVDLEDADAEAARIWEHTTPLERLAAVEAIRRATFALHRPAVRGLERVLEVADAPSRTETRAAVSCIV